MNSEMRVGALSSLLIFGCHVPAGSEGQGEEETGAEDTTGAMSTMGADTKGADTDTESDTGAESDSGDAACDLMTLPLEGEFYGEGIAAAPDGALYVASFANGQIVRFDPCDDTPQDFAESAILGPAGVLVDEQAGVLWACVSDLMFTVPAALVGYDLQDGSEQIRHEVAPGGWCGDMTQAADGTIYVTDPVINAVYGLTPEAVLNEGALMIWSDDPALRTDDGNFGLNGLAIAGGNLYLNHSNGSLYRLPIEDDGSAGAAISIALPRPLEGADGLEPLDDTRLLVVENVRGEVNMITLDDSDTATLSNLADGLSFPTTVAIAGARGWVMEGQLDHLLGTDPAPPDLPFRVVGIDLP